MTAASGLRRSSSAKNDGATDALLAVEGLTVRYGPIEAVRGLSLNVKQGEIVTLLGANGAGKSSTLGAIVGLVPVAGGSIRFEGREIGGLATEAIVRRGIALVPEGRHLFRNMSVYENLRLGAATLGRPAFDELLPQVLGTFPVVRQRLHATAGLLSGGEQQQVAIARALLSRPRVLLLDEPSLGLAPIIVARVFDIIRSLRDSGVTILLVEQNVERALAIADRAYVLASGSLELAGAASAIASTAIEQAYLGISAAPTA
jgi:branched-chain amino acid transport system ATP-binding protein